MFKPVLPFSSRALILGVSGGARGHVSLISSMVRVCWLTGFPHVEQSGGDAVKIAAHGVFLLINPEVGVRAWGWGVKNKNKKSWEKAVQFTLITAYVLSIVFITLCGVHTYVRLIAQEVKQTISLKSPAASIHCLRRRRKWKPDV